MGEGKVEGMGRGCTFTLRDLAGSQGKGKEGRGEEKRASVCWRNFASPPRELLGISYLI